VWRAYSGDNARWRDQRDCIAPERPARARSGDRAAAGESPPLPVRRGHPRYAPEHQCKGWYQIWGRGGKSVNTPRTGRQQAGRSPR
jgi:hypothetical protein